MYRLIPRMLLLVVIPGFVSAQERNGTPNGDGMIARYFDAETKKIEHTTLARDKSLEDWKNHREKYKRQLLEMPSHVPVLRLHRLTFGRDDQVVEFVRAAYRGDRYQLHVELR